MHRERPHSVDLIDKTEFTFMHLCSAVNKELTCLNHSTHIQICQRCSHSHRVNIVCCGGNHGPRTRGQDSLFSVTA